MTADRVRELLVCPSCRGKLAFSAVDVQCTACNATYPFDQGVPVLLARQSTSTASPTVAVDANQSSARDALPGFVRKIVKPVLDFNPVLGVWTDKRIFDELNATKPGEAILNLGSGIGIYDQRYIAPHVEFIKLDISAHAALDVVADAHWLPFPDDSLDGVYSNAVLEHVERPWLIAEEMRRVVKPGGKVYINVPFLYPIHDAHDFYRFTDRGLEALFSGFRKVASGVSSGPSSFLAPFLIEYLLCFVPGRLLKAVARRVLAVLTYPLALLDYVIRRSPNLRNAADSFYFVGVKAD